MSIILKAPAEFDGCDFVLQLGAERMNTKIKLLQLTDMQFIDSLQRRTDDRLPIDEINAWHPDLFSENCGNQIRSLIAQTLPDLIFITGDMVYGSFDDKGTTLRWFCEFMDSFEIPWAIVFGNHDNESETGVDWQCEQYESSKYCIFARGNVSGNSNYTLGIACGDTLVRVMYMTDSNGCVSNDQSVIRAAGIYHDQLERIRESSDKIRLAHGQAVPAFMAYHIPTAHFSLAEAAKGYSGAAYTIGVDFPALDGDFGCKKKHFSNAKTDDDFLPTIKSCGVEAIFVGHQHTNNVCIHHDGITYVCGLKTGLYDYHTPYQVGGTLVTLEGTHFTVQHVPALAPLSPLPGKDTAFKDFFANDTTLDR